MAKAIWFDMDGTIYDLYGQENWLEKVRNKDSRVFYTGSPLQPVERLMQALKALKDNGWHIGVITWAPKGVDSGDPFFEDVAMMKQGWLAKYYPDLLQNFYCIPYGEDKSLTAYHHWENRKEVIENQILVDDNLLVRQMWLDNWVDFTAIDATEDFLQKLEGLVM